MIGCNFSKIFSFFFCKYHLLNFFNEKTWSSWHLLWFREYSTLEVSYLSEMFLDFFFKLQNTVETHPFHDFFFYFVNGIMEKSLSINFDRCQKLLTVKKANSDKILT